MRRLVAIIAACSLLLTGCSIAKVSKPMLRLFVGVSQMGTTPPSYADECEILIGIPYVQGGDERQVLDVYYASDSLRRGAVLIDIHGGFYVGGKRESNRPFASEFLKEGFDVVLVEYRLNDGVRDVGDELSDCAAALDFLYDHAEDLGLNKDRMFVTGDSAGGHFALYLAEGAFNEALPVRPQRFKPSGVLLNCPVYDFVSCANTRVFADPTLAWFIGPRFKDKEWMASLSPRTYIDGFSCPLFVSTCKRDFVRIQAEYLKADCDSLGLSFEYLDIDSDKRKVGHVHNVTDPTLPESRLVNESMIRFMTENCL